MQRIFDIFFSSLSILFLMPLFTPIIIVLRFSGEGEIFFLQDRVGLNNKTFKLYKFATMLKESPNIGTGTVTLKNDHRVLPFGKILRKTKINELPQIANVFLGDMSFIGPRPQTRRCFKAYPYKSQKEIIKVKPGLSGIGSIIFRDEEDIMSKQDEPIDFYDSTLMPYKGLLEEWYIKNNTIGVYFFLIYATIMKIIFRSDSISLLYRNIELPPVPDQLKLWIK